MLATSRCVAEVVVDELLCKSRVEFIRDMLPCAPRLPLYSRQ
eukprot:IDg865t1